VKCGVTVADKSSLRSYRQQAATVEEVNSSKANVDNATLIERMELAAA